MKYISDIDYEYVMNKHHDRSRPYDIMNRFVRHDEIFDSATGMDGDEIAERLLLLDSENLDKPHPVRKAIALRFVLENTRIACDPRDLFPAINAMDRPLTGTLVRKWRAEALGEIIPEADRRRTEAQRNGAFTVWPDYDHSVPDWERMLSLGFTGILAEAREARRVHGDGYGQEGFYEGIEITYSAIITFIGRLAALAEATRGSEKLAKALRTLECGAPVSFYDALLFNYLYFIICEHIESLQVRSLSNFDRIFYPYFARDLAAGMSEDELRSELAYYLLQFAAIDNYWGQPVYLGGCRADESTVINDLSYAFLEVYDALGIYNPKIQLKIAESTPESFVRYALDMIRRGNNSIVFVSDATVRRALEKFGHSPDAARLADIKGCYEYAIVGGVDIGMNYTNLMKPLEYALHEGRDAVSGAMSGLPCKPAEEYGSFEELYAEYKRQLANTVEKVIGIANQVDDYLAYMNPQSMLSATFPSCLERGRDALAGGALANDTSLACGFIADVADSLTNIKKYVFEKKAFTLAELRDILDKNFEGCERERLILYRDPEKYGNNRETPDFFAGDIADFLCATVCGRPNATERCGKWTVGFHVARQSYIQGAKTAASANGRRFGEELSKNCSASMGQNREGATAAILSVTKLDATASPGDFSLDLGLLPSAVRGDDGLVAMRGLLDTFIRRGGHALHINVFDAETLREAQAHPEKYEDLQIRVCGWNVLWNNISKTEQDGFIRQAESLM